MDGLIKFTIPLIMITLFSFALIGFSFSFSDDNDVAIDLRNDSDISGLQTTLQSDVNSQISSINSSQDAFFTTESESGDQQSKSGGQFKTSIGSVISSSTNVLRVGWKKIFGSDGTFGLFITAFIGILVFIGIMLGYKAWFGRSP